MKEKFDFSLNKLKSSHSIELRSIYLAFLSTTITMLKKLTLALLTLCAANLTAQTGSAWNNCGGNPQKNGFVNTSGPTTDSILWEVYSPGYFGIPSFIENNHLVTMRFLGLTNAPIECYDLTTGDLLWSQDVTGQSGRSLPVGLRDNRVYAVRYTESTNDTLYALDASTGNQLWTAAVTVAPYITTSATFDDDGFVYIEGYQKIYKLDPENGELIWEMPTIPLASGSGEIAINSAINKGYTVEQIQGQAFVWAIDLNTGEKLYNHIVNETFPGGGVLQSALMIGFDGVVYVQKQEDNISAFADSGSEFTLLWEAPISGNAPFSHMCIGADGSIYGTSDGHVIRVNAQTGAIMNTSQSIAQDGVFTQRTSATANGMIYATNGADSLYAFNSTLELMWSAQIEGVNTSGACIAPNGLLVVSGTQKIRVYTPTIDSNVNEIAQAYLSCYPNPTDASTVIVAQPEHIGITYCLHDMQGSLVERGVIRSAVNTLTLEHLPCGIYILHTGATSEGVRIVKE